MGELINFCAGMKSEVAPASQVPAILINVAQYTSTEREIAYTLKMLEDLKPRHVRMDSSGFQFLDRELKGGIIGFDATRPLIYNDGEINLTPSHLIQAVKRINPHSMIALDWPVLKTSIWNMQDREFRKKLGCNITWLTETAALRRERCLDVELYIPIQAYDLEQFRYYESHLAGIEYDGFAIPTRNLNAYGVSLFLVKFYQMGVRRVHILSYCSFTGIALAAYFARHVFDVVSIDATTWRYLADIHEYLDPRDLASLDVKRESPLDGTMEIQCNCPWCSYHRTFSEIKNMDGTDKTAFLGSHNWFVVESLVRDFYNYSTDLGRLEDHMRGRTRRQVRKMRELFDALSIVELFKDDDFYFIKRLLENEGNLEKM